LSEESLSNLEELRLRIDDLDDKIVALLSERARVVVEIGTAKKAQQVISFTPERERRVLDRITGANTGPLSNETLIAIYRELMSGSLALERPPRIAYLGPEGSFSHLAARRKFGASVEARPVRTITAVFDEVEKDHADIGLVPVENSIGGGITETLDSFLTREVRICGELNLSIHHHVLGLGSLSGAREIHSKPEVFAQCQLWLTKTGWADRTVPAASSSQAAELAKSDSRIVAIGSELAAELYDLEILCSRVEDNPNNVTRFLLIGREWAGRTGRDKTTILFHTTDQPGALVDVLDVWRRAGLNLTRIESRPSKQRNWDYTFFTDITGHIDDENLTSAIEDARPLCKRIDVLGSFPMADEVL
jgi:chorismate mutase/prephenate dehydratase